MRYFVFLLGILWLFAFSACNGQETKPPSQQTKAEPSAPAKADREVGKVVPSEPIAGSTASYAVYLPTGYRHDHPAPIVLFFDSHARGKEPVTRYQSLADRHHTVLVGSNVSRNGQQPQQSLHIYDELMQDVRAKFSIDNARITACGFSGGARVAAMIAQNRPEVRNVIACSAGFQPRRGDTFNYYAIVGKEDFNYLELLQLEGLLDQTPQRHIVNYWDGGHEWPPVEVMADAFEFVWFRGMEKTEPKLDSLVQDVRTRFVNAKQSLPQSGARILRTRWRLYKALIAKLDGLVDVTAEKDDMAKLVASREFASAEDVENKDTGMEIAMRDQSVPQISTETVDFWRKLSTTLRTRHDSQSVMHQIDLRVLNFLSLNTYFQVDAALKSGDLPRTEHFLQIYALIDPPNPEHAYLTAVVRMRQGRPEDALQSLHTAQKLGFKDADRLAADPEFTGLRGRAEFVKLLEDMRALP